MRTSSNHRPKEYRDCYLGSWVVARDGEEGEYFFEGTGGQITSHTVLSEAIGICLRWWPAESEGTGQTQVGAMANLLAPYFFPEGTQGKFTVEALNLVR